MPRGGSVAGVLILNGSASPAGWTACASDGFAQVAEAPIASDGSFRIDDLHPGGWQVSVFEPGERYHATGGSLRTERVPEPVLEVIAGKTVAYQHSTTLKKSARLEGRLLIDGDAPGTRSREDSALPGWVLFLCCAGGKRVTVRASIRNPRYPWRFCACHE